MFNLLEKLLKRPILVLTVFLGITVFFVMEMKNKNLKYYNRETIHLRIDLLLKKLGIYLNRNFFKKKYMTV